MKKLQLFLCTVTVILLTAVSSWATTLTYDLNINLTSGSFTSPSPWGTVVLADDITPGAVNFTVTLADGFDFVHTGAGSESAFLFNSSSAIDISNNFVSVDPPSSANPTLGILYGDPLLATKGGFDYGVYFEPNVNGINESPSPISFTILGSEIGDFIDPSLNTDGYLFAADVIGNGNTGLIATGATSIPEPATMLLLGTGLLGFAVARRKIKS